MLIELFSDLIEEDLPPATQKELSKWPFTWEGRTFHKIKANGPDGKYGLEQQRNIIRSFLRLGISICDDQVELLRQNPEHTQWLKARLEPELWDKIQPLCSLPNQEGNKARETTPI